MPATVLAMMIRWPRLTVRSKPRFARRFGSVITTPSAARADHGAAPDTGAAVAWVAGVAPIPVSSGRTDRHRLDRGGNRQLNYAIHMIALSRLRHDPQTAIYIAKQRARGKTSREAIRCLKRHLIRRIYRLLTNPNAVPRTVCLT